MPFDFDTPINRKGTECLKWDIYQGRDVLPLWVADMDFASPPAYSRPCMSAWTTASSDIILTFLGHSRRRSLKGSASGMAGRCIPIGLSGYQVWLRASISPAVLSALQARLYLTTTPAYPPNTRSSRTGRMRTYHR